MTLVDKYEFQAWKFSLFFLQSLPAGTKYELEPGSDEAHRYVWSTPGVTIELTHNWGTESDASFKHHPGNEPGDGFGHIAFSVPSLEEAVAKLDALAIPFKKRPEEGRMRSIAFLYDADRYWVELVERIPALAAADVLAPPYFALAQTMLRVKDPEKSLAFYTQHLGMTLVRKSVADSFTVYFLATLPVGCAGLPADPESPEARAFVKDRLYPACIPVLELTWNHGTESQPDFKHATGNEEGRRGFGHIGFLVGDVYETYERLKAAGVEFHKTPDGGSMKGLAFARDPDGYLVEIIKRGQAGKFD